MFDISFTELMVIGVVALVVIGPERLPGVARTAGALLGRLQRYVSDVKADVQREMRLEEMKKLQDEIESQARGIETQVRSEMQAVEQSVDDAAAPLATLPEPLAATPARTETRDDKALQPASTGSSAPSLPANAAAAPKVADVPRTVEQNRQEGKA